MPQAPVRPSQVQRTEERVDPAQRNLIVISDTLKSNSGAQAKAIRAMLGGDKALMDRFLAATFSMLAQNSDVLRRATPLSVVDAIKTAASMGLEPGTDDGAIVVYGDKAQFRPMYRGYLKRIRNSGKVDEVDTQIVYENDEFEIGLGTDPYILHRPSRTMKDTDGVIVQDRGGYRGVYAWALMPSGKTLIEWMEESEVNYVRDTFAQARKSDSPWNTSWGEMARKTVLRRLSKRLPAAAVDVLLEADSAADQLEQQEVRPDTVAEELRRRAIEATVNLVPGTVAPPSDVPNDSPQPAPTDTEVQPDPEPVDALQAAVDPRDRFMEEMS